MISGRKDIVGLDKQRIDTDNLKGFFVSLLPLDCRPRGPAGRWIARSPSHYQQRSAVVTRRSESAVTRHLAGFGKFLTSDMAAKRVFSGQPGNQRHSQSGLSDCSRRYRSVGEPCWTISEGQGSAKSRSRRPKKTPLQGRGF